MVPEVAAGFGRSETIRLGMSMAEESAIHLWETPLSTDHTISTVDESGFVQVKATVENTQQLLWWLLGFGDYAQVLKLARLAKAIHAIHVRAANA